MPPSSKDLSDQLRIALMIAATVENQRLVLQAVDRVNRTTDALIATNLTDLQKRASTTTPVPEKLKAAFEQIEVMLKGIERFRRKTLFTTDEDLRQLNSLSGRVARFIKSVTKKAHKTRR